jgi:hypothetical protein
MSVPLGLRMAIGCRAGRLLTTGVSIVKKLAVQPESAMALVNGSAGGPTVDNVDELPEKEVPLFIILVVGFPQRHDGGAAL